MKRQKRKQQKRVTSNRRVDVAPAGGPLASLGLYTKPVQRVVAKWKDRIPPETIERYFFAVGMAVLHPDGRIDLPFVPSQHWPFIFEVGNALTSVWDDLSKPPAWLLRMNHCAVNGQWDKWETEAWNIRKQGGPLFSATALAKAADRMRLLTPPNLTADFLNTRPKW